MSKTQKIIQIATLGLIIGLVAYTAVQAFRKPKSCTKCKEIINLDLLDFDDEEAEE